MSWLATKLVGIFLLPPLNLLIVAGLGIVLLNNHPRLGRNLTSYHTSYQLTLLDFLPRGRALAMSFIAIHEWIGRLWYLFG